MDRIETMKSRLETALAPSFLEIIDDSAEHVGHAGNPGTAGHYTVKITSQAFEGKSPVQTHQLVYAALGDMIGPEIHAVRIEAKSA